MKAKTVILIAVLFAAVLTAAVLGYNYLSEQYMPQEPETQESAADKAPDFTVQDINGREVALSDFAGKPVVINFWATWCGPCKTELPYFHDAYAEYGDRVEFLMINVDGGADDVNTVKKFVAENGYQFPLYFDGNYSASIAYVVDAIPETVFVTADGDISYRKTGVISENQLNAELERIIEEAQ